MGDLLPAEVYDQGEESYLAYLLARQEHGIPQARCAGAEKGGIPYCVSGQGGSQEDSSDA